MSEGEQITISLVGGGPWGLRLQGGKDFGAPLTIARVTPAGKADKSGVKPNDIIVSINGLSTLSIAHLDAQQLVKNAGKSLALELIRGRDLLAAPMPVPVPTSSSASSASSSPGPSLGRQAPPWQKGKADAPLNANDSVQDLPPPPPFVTNSDTSGAASASSSPGVSQSSTPSRAAAPWKQTAPGPQDQASPIPSEVADIASRRSPPIDRRASKDEEVVHGGAFRRLQHQVETMAVGDEPVQSALSPGAPKTGATASPSSRRISSGSSATSPVARGSSPSTPRATAAPARAQPSAASPSAKVNLADNLNKLRASENLQKAQKSAMTDGGAGGAGGASRQDAAKRIGGLIPDCGGCGSPIDGAYIQAIGKQWHAEHFVCSSCGTQLKSCPFVEHEGKMFCESCYTDYFASRCSACNKTIKGECVSASGKELHPACFRCTRCGTSLSGQGFHSQDGNFYCSEDYEALFSVVCTGCEQPVKNNELWVEALGGQWHDTCFACTVCQKPLQGGKFFAKLGRPYCKDHA